jgi:hypothetical protein
MISLERARVALTGFDYREVPSPCCTPRIGSTVEAGGGAVNQ